MQQSNNLGKVKRYRVYAGDAYTVDGEPMPHGDVGYRHHDGVLAEDYDRERERAERAERERDEFKELNRKNYQWANEEADKADRLKEHAEALAEAAVFMLWAASANAHDEWVAAHDRLKDARDAYRKEYGDG